MKNQSHLFSLEKDVSYLNCAYKSPQLKAVEHVGKKRIEYKNNPWKLKVEAFFEPCERVRKQVACLIDASADDIAIIPSASYGIGIAANNIPLEAGDRILCLDQQFPSNVYPWLELAKEKKAKVDFVKRENSNWTDAILKTIDSKTRVLAIPNVHWTDGRFIDLKKISDFIQGKNIVLVLDLTQSLAALPISIKDVKADFIISSAYKWLLGPYGMGFLYVNPKWQKGKPLEYNWITRKGSDEFSELVEYTDEFAKGARRFDVGERSHFNLMPMAEKALEQILEWGVPQIKAYINVLTDHLACSCRNAALRVAHDAERSAHILGIEFDESIPQALIQKLQDKKIFISIRGRSIRVSPYLYNSKADIDRLMEALIR